MEIILNLQDISERGRGKHYRDLDLADFHTMDLRVASMAHKVSFIYGKEKVVLKDRTRRGR